LVIVPYVVAGLALVSFALMIWQWLVALRFPLHRRSAAHSFPPAVTILKPLKGCDMETARCLESWFLQDYTGRIQILFAVASQDDLSVPVVQRLIAKFPSIDAQLVVCTRPLKANAKVSKLAQLVAHAQHDVFVISDADVEVPADFLSQVVEPLRKEQTGLVNCFYTLANPSTLAMHCEALAINADFWSQVLQAQSLKPINFALGAVMVTRRKQLESIGGFESLEDCLADDYQLGNRIFKSGASIAISPVVVSCRSEPMSWLDVWKHQLRWARTIRVCQPVPYFFSILSNVTFWTLLWVLISFGRWTLFFATGILLLRLLMGIHLQWRLTRRLFHVPLGWLVWVKDAMQLAVWVAAFAGNTVEWRGRKMRLKGDGTIEEI
jgi:ceramide glucosyltransferase